MGRTMTTEKKKRPRSPSPPPPLLVDDGGSVSSRSSSRGTGVAGGDGGSTPKPPLAGRARRRHQQQQLEVRGGLIYTHGPEVMPNTRPASDRIQLNLTRSIPTYYYLCACGVQVHIVEDHGDALEHLYDAIGVRRACVNHPSPRPKPVVASRTHTNTHDW